MGHDGLRRPGRLDLRLGLRRARFFRGTRGRPGSASSRTGRSAESVRSLVFAFTARGVSPLAVAILMAGAGLFAFLESVRSGIDDNLVPALPTLFFLAWVSLAYPPFPAPGRPPLWLAVLVNAAVAVVAHRARAVSLSGAVRGRHRRHGDFRRGRRGRLRRALELLSRGHDRVASRISREIEARHGAGARGPARRGARGRQLLRGGAHRSAVAVPGALGTRLRGVFRGGPRRHAGHGVREPLRKTRVFAARPGRARRRNAGRDLVAGTRGRGRRRGAHRRHRAARGARAGGGNLGGRGRGLPRSARRKRGERSRTPPRASRSITSSPTR